jgi:hypothetical protein
MRVSDQCHALAALPPVKTQCPVYGRLGGSQGRPGRVQKISPLLGFDLHTVQPLASCYIDYANLAHVHSSYKKCAWHCLILNPWVSVSHTVTWLACNKDNAWISYCVKWCTEGTYVPYFHLCHEGIYSQGRFMYCVLSVIVSIQPVLHIHLQSTCSRPQCDTTESNPHYHHYYYTQSTVRMNAGPPWSLCLIATDPPFLPPFFFYLFMFLFIYLHPIDHYKW